CGASGGHGAVHVFPPGSGDVGQHAVRGRVEGLKLFAAGAVHPFAVDEQLPLGLVELDGRGGGDGGCVGHRAVITPYYSKMSATCRVRPGSTPGVSVSPRRNTCTAW